MKPATRSRLQRDAMLIFGVAALLLIAASLGLQLWVARSGAPGIGSLWGTALAMLSALLVLAAGAAYVRLISKRVDHLLQGLEAVRRGQFPLMAVRGEDDVAQLTLGFNQLVQELRARRESLVDLVESKGTEPSPLAKAPPPEKGKLESRLEKVGEGAIVLDLDGRVVMANEQVSAILGLPAATLQGAPIRTLIDQMRHRLINLPAVEHLLRELETGRHSRDERWIELDTPGGPLIRLYSAPVRGDDSAMLGRIVTLMELGREREVERLKTEFLSTISHELRTPLTSAKGALGLIRGGVTGQISADMQDLLEIASSNIDRLIAVINNILDVLSLERGQGGFRFSPISLKDCVARATDVVRVQGQQAGVTLVAELPQDLPGVRGDAKRLEQVMVNLLSNAIKFSEQGQMVLVAAAKEDGRLKVSVQDSGRGISREAIGRLFQKFEHSEEALTRGTQGAGLGLAICRHIVEAHGGRIWVDSAEGSGSTFSFTLPLETPTADPSSFRRTPAERAGELA